MIRIQLGLWIQIWIWIQKGKITYRKGKTQKFRSLQTIMFSLKDPPAASNPLRRFKKKYVEIERKLFSFFQL
jgi:hypothetical protein